jgi:hypothetical protein
MSPWITVLLILSLLLMAILGLADAWATRSVRKLSAWLVTCLITALILHVALGFPNLTQQAAFGSTAGLSQLLTVALMFVAILLGIVATYFFNLSGPFSWKDFLRPIAVSPLVLLPLIGSIQGAELQQIQVICILIIAFQNGFFWQQVLKDAKPKS